MQERKKASALKYDPAYDEMQLVANGVGYVAERILEKAAESKVPIIYNKEIADLLSAIDIDDIIPEEMYQALSEILAFIMEVDTNIKD